MVLRDHSIPGLNVDIDPLDYQYLAQLVFKTAVNDYLHLQHPNKRKRKHNQVAFETACDMFFDDSYLFKHFQDEWGKDITLQQFVGIATDDEYQDLETLREWLIQESLVYWARQDVQTIEIPSEIVIEGHVYHIEHRTMPETLVDYKTKIIVLNKDSKDSENQERFMEAVMFLLLHHTEIKIPGKTLTSLSKAFFRTLRINSCFTGASNG